MSSSFDNWKKALESLEASVGKELAEIRSCKREVQLARMAILDQETRGRYFRDDQRIILSAPEIIIGDVDKNGVMIGNGSVVVLRGSNVSLEGIGAGAGMGGSVITRAASIRQIAADPGIDGQENSVMGTSEIINLGRNIVLHSSDATECFYEAPASVGNGVSIHSDTLLNIDASVSNTIRKQTIEDAIAALKERKSDEEKSMKDLKKQTDKVMEDIDKTLEKQDSLMESINDVRTNVYDIDQLNQKFDQLSEVLSSVSASYQYAISRLAETTRQLAALEKAKSEVGEAADKYKDDPTGAMLAINAELVSITTNDGDGNIRVNPESGIEVSSTNVAINAHQADGSLTEKSYVRINTENFDLNTQSAKLDEKQEKGDITATGSVKITSKDITVQAIDSELKDKKVVEKALTEKGSITMRAENISAASYKTDGELTGSIVLNAKEMEIAAMKMKKEGEGEEAKYKEEKLADGSKLTVLAEKMFIGSQKNDNTKTKLVQIGSEKVGIIAKDTAEMQQGEAKAVLTLDGGNFTAGASANKLQGNTTIEGNAEIKGETKTPKLTSDQVEAKSAFKSPNINDTQGAGVPGQAGQPSAKMQEEEVKPKE